jgi:hypothetical protein
MYVRPHHAQRVRVPEVLFDIMVGDRSTWYLLLGAADELVVDVVKFCTKVTL